MKRLFVAMMLLPLLAQGQTLEECQQAAERNYPLISQYGLIEKTTDLTMSNLSKGWLPQVTASAQATYQSDVVAWPDQMQTIYQQMGLDMKGLKKDQYKVGIDVQQMVFDGGAISSQRDIAREQGRVQEAQTEVTMYQVRRRVNEMYFGLLMLDEQIALNNDLQSLLAANEQKLSSMWKRGTASESDYQAVKAERLNVMQQATTLDAQRRAVMRMLSAFCGMEVTHVEKPALIALPSQDVAQRPELKAIDAQLSLANAQERLLNAALRPRLSLFATGFYGYPGYNMFDDMMSHDWSWNGMVGARLSWNLGAFYTHRNDKAKIRLQRDMAETSREVFLFNNRLELIQQNENIEQYRRLMNDDEEIIALRSSVRKAAESKLAHGIIDVNDLVKEINAENAARVQQSMHEIKLLKEVYDMKFTTNN
ncbi:MAG: TolC family protein [Bacteroidales bacterium]|nr:TolC family protein [Bacteroidales bacterium]